MASISKALWFVSLLLVFAGCGVTPTAGTPGGSSTAATGNNTTPPTSTSGPITLATDHSSYAPTDALHLTVTNTTSAPVYALDHQASCSLLALEYQVSGVWKNVSQAPYSLARCAQETPTRVIAIAAGTTYQANVMAGYLQRGDAAFPDGQYRFALRFTNQIPGTAGGADLPNPQTMYSATLTIDSHIPAQPTQPVATTPPGPVSATASPTK